MTGGSLDGERPLPEPTVEVDTRAALAGMATTAPRPATTAWTAAAASTIGSVHVRDGLPIQDAVLTWSEGDRAVIAVADGHGHHTHFRSDTGAALAVVAAVEELRAGLTDLASLPRESDSSIALRAIAERIVASWQAKVAQHRAASPFEGAEAEAAAQDPLRPYGTTLLSVGVVADLVVCLQIGDGDAVLVDHTGSARRAVADHPDLDGVRTHSLCQPDPMTGLRVSAIDTSEEDVALIFLCSDGFGGSRVDADWWQQTGEQLLGFTRERGVQWVRGQLSSWLAEPALVGGDDTTLALLVRSALSA